MTARRGRREKILLAARVCFFVAVLIGAAIVEYTVRDAIDDPAAFSPIAPPATATAPTNTAAPATRRAEGEIEAAFRAQRSGFMTTADGSVSKILPDDRKGSRHQRFVLRLASGHTVLVAHNVDLANRVPLEHGDPVRLHGQYEWNERGGVVHWTHHDPDGRHEVGWIEHHGERYQ
jgi:hypothetical protein